MDLVAASTASLAPDLAGPPGLTVRLQRLINAPAAKVWDIISDPAGMRKWLGPQVFEAQLGGRVLIDCLHGPREDGQRQRWVMFGNIAVWEPERELAFTWQEFNVNDLVLWPTATLVRVTLEKQPGGTLVTLGHSGFEALPDGEHQCNEYREGWASLNDLETLAQMCETVQQQA